MKHTASVRLFAFSFYIFCITAHSADVPLLPITSRMQCTDFDLSWSAVTKADHYRLWYQPFNATSWQHLDFSADTHNFSVSGLPEGQRYKTRLDAMDQQDQLLSASSYTFLQPGNLLQPPLLILTLDGTRATASWNAIPGADHYDFYYSVNSQSGKLLLPSDPQTLSVDFPSNTYASGALLTVDQDGFFISDSYPDEPIYVGSTPDAVNTFQTGGYLSIFRNVVSGALPASLAQVLPAQTSSPFATVLQDCLYSLERQAPCSLSRLPLIGQDHPRPDVATIMDRVVASDTWMSERFRQILTLVPPDMLLLFRGVTGIVIAGDVNASRYGVFSGAIYLDPASLWVSSEEQATVHTEADPRTSCDAKLKYYSSGGYLLNGKPLLLSSTSRPLDNVLIRTASTLIHELTHANDYIPPAFQASLPLHLTPYEAALLNQSQRVSNLVTSHFSPRSTTLKYLARLKQNCKGATCAQLNTSAQAAARELIGDLVNDSYNYTNAHEDVAMISEELLSRYFLKTERRIYFRDKQGDSVNTAAYGIRQGLIGDSKLKEKARFITQRILPEVDLNTYIDNLPAPTVIPDGTLACDFIPCTNSKNRTGSKESFMEERSPPYL